MALLAFVAATLVAAAPADDWSRLRAHPLRMPTLPAGAACPVSRVGLGFSRTIVFRAVAGPG